MLTEVPGFERIRVGRGTDGLEFCPGKQFVGRDKALPYFASLLGNDLDFFCQFVTVSQKEIQVEAAGSIE